MGARISSKTKTTNNQNSSSKQYQRKVGKEIVIVIEKPKGYQKQSIQSQVIGNNQKGKIPTIPSMVQKKPPAPSNVILNTDSSGNSEVKKQINNSGVDNYDIPSDIISSNQPTIKPQPVLSKNEIITANQMIVVETVFDNVKVLGRNT